MTFTKHAYTAEQLMDIASILQEEICAQESSVVSRYTRTCYDNATFIDGVKSSQHSFEAGTNKEHIDKGIYTSSGAGVPFSPEHFQKIALARDLEEHRFNFQPKQILLPTTEEIRYENIPEAIEQYDAQLCTFTKEHEHTSIGRYARVEQTVVVNSQGGISIQSIPFFTICYQQGITPLQIQRNIGGVCTSDEDISKVKMHLAYLSDPTQDGCIRKATSLSEAFHHLWQLAPLKYGSIEEAGFPLIGLHDVIVLNGVPAHEVFGHHFEEPIRYLDFRETAAFRHEQEVPDKNMLFQDNSAQEVAGLRAEGFTFFDAYGRKRPSRTHISNGKVLEFLGSEYADPHHLKSYLNIEKSEAVGNATQGPNGHFPMPRMSCTVLDGKVERVNLENKLLMIPYRGHTRPDDKTYMIEANECYVLRDGKVSRLPPMRMTGGIHQAMSNLVLLEDQTYDFGVCGNPEQLYGKSTVQVPVSQFCRVQLWQGQQIFPTQFTKKQLDVLIEKK